MAFLEHASYFSAAGMRCKMLELLQTHWWRTSSLCLHAFSWAQKTAFPLQLKQALTLHLDLQLQVCSLSGQHSSMEEKWNNPEFISSSKLEKLVRIIGTRQNQLQLQFIGGGRDRKRCQDLNLPVCLTPERFKLNMQQNGWLSGDGNPPLGFPVKQFTYKYTVFILRIPVRKSCKVIVFCPDTSNVSGRPVWLHLDV